MTKKEVVATLRRAFNSWAASLPDDVDYKSCNDASNYYDDDGSVNNLHVLELGAEEEGDQR